MRTPFAAIIVLLISCGCGAGMNTGQPAAEVSPTPVPGDEPGSHEDALLIVRRDGDMGWADTSCTIVIEPIFDEVTGFESGLASVRLGSSWGFIDQAGKLVVNFLYTDARPFSGPVAAVKTADGWGYIDTKGALVIPPQYSDATRHEGGIALVKKDGVSGIIDEQGNEIAMSFDGSLHDLGMGVIGHRPEGSETWRLLDSSGHRMGENELDAPGHFSEGLVQVDLQG